MITFTECVEKQYRKPPRLASVTVDVFRCPSCNELLAAKVGAFIGGKKTEYCSQCGQRLLWEE